MAVAGTFVSVGDIEGVNVGDGVFVGTAGWNGVADADFCPFGITNSAKGGGVGEGVAGDAHEERRRLTPSKTKMRKLMRDASHREVSL